MPLQFVGDAIRLSGSAGSKLKCSVIGEYYGFWWSITSGGGSHSHSATIVELNAATGEVYIEDNKETVLGSAGHALELKTKTLGAEKLRIVLVEEDVECYEKLKSIIRRRWPSIPLEEIEGSDTNSYNVNLINLPLDKAVDTISNLDFGNALFFFDPLRSVAYDSLESIASKRINTFFRKGTEFFVFVFTSDWFLGRDDFAPLPCTVNENEWSDSERATVVEADSFYGDILWRPYLLNENSLYEKQETLIELYKMRLHKWFRYTLPLPFNPKNNQLFHLILCSNYEKGVRATKDFYSLRTSNVRYSPDNVSALKRFSLHHPEIFVGLREKKRPLVWRILWTVIRQHEEGICDQLSPDLVELDPMRSLQPSLEWLQLKGYLVPLQVENAWDMPIQQYKLNWEVVKKELGVCPPKKLKPISQKGYSWLTVNEQG